VSAQRTERPTRRVLSRDTVSGASILVTVKLTERSERKLCAVVSSADDGYRTQPPPSTAGKLQAHNIAELRKTLGCPPPEGE
jgi:hypothetical protein